AVDALPVEGDLALRAHHAAERAQRRRLAGAIRAEERGDGAFIHREADAVQHAREPVLGMQVLRGEERHRQAVPRYAWITSGCFCTSAGLPSAIFLPKFSATTRSEMLITRLMWCSTRSTVSEILSRMSLIRRRSAPTSSCFRPLAGSSSNRSFVSAASAR